jgi:putative FmdB family regulatory protein
MPTYDYECKKCQHKFEISQKMTDKPLTTCPKCKGSLRRLIGAGSGIIFKGAGFYATDYRKKPVKDQPAKEGRCPDVKPECKSCPNQTDNKGK